MRPVVTYIRVNTSRQDRSGLGIEAKRDAFARFVGGEGFELVAEFGEIETGKGSDALDRRPQLAAALSRARALRCPVKVAKLDRLSRDVHPSRSVCCIGIGPQGRPLRSHLFAALAEKERALISAHTKAALAAAKMKGVKLGNPQIEAARVRAVASI
jgi:DNA invertase Pin-like site-specific DNA recombinase